MPARLSNDGINWPIRLRNFRLAALSDFGEQSLQRPEPQACMRLTALTLLIVGGTLLALSAVGEWGWYSGIAKVGERPTERFDPTLATELRSLEEFRDYILRLDSGTFETLSDSQKMEVLYQAVTNRFVRGDTQHTVFTNWIMWGLGFLRHDISTMRVPNNLLRFGEEAICGQSSYVLLTLVRSFGIPARHVGLGGHIVMEAWYDGNWHMYDTDQEVIPMVAGQMFSVDELARRQDLIRQFYGDRISLNNSPIQAVLMNRQNHTYANHKGDQFVWSAQVLMLAERVAEVLKHVFPVFLLGIGIMLLRRQKQLEF